MKWESIIELKAWLKKKQLINSIKFILSVKNLLPVLLGFGVRVKAKQYQMDEERAKGENKDDKGKALYEESKEGENHNDDKYVC